MPEYQFKFFHGDAYRAIYICAVDSDREACDIARAYLRESPEFDVVEVRCGLRFMQRIGKPRLVE